MRKFALGFGMAFLCLFCCSANATVLGSDNMNSRIKSLQERLKQFHNKAFADEEERMIVEEEVVDLILEKTDESILASSDVQITHEMAERIVEELESRSDVAMTVLFHDNESEGFFGVSKEFTMIDPPKVIIDDSEDEKVASAKESINRQEVIANLRQRVLEASRCSQEEADSISRQIASLK